MCIDYPKQLKNANELFQKLKIKELLKTGEDILIISNS